ncbi:uncharacterized protein LOC129915410 isoform X2 [Episyrphus balteatus]|uniref:uncharacterized protein LOC129915410 isoform X2 n=1 Tax=Episyrphus balteatus TaxID=286459 RepID=UPI002485C02B|nr:uncharacterized protein LOC129915410 isoform X2 [Episyrphus balteatus]
MASNNEEIIQYHIFLKNICKSTNPQDSTESLLKTTTTTSSNTTTAAPQLRNRITCPDDAEGEVIYWILKFLDENKCPTKLISPIVRNVLVEILNDARFKETNGLRALATTIVEDFCASLLNNVELNKIIDTATSADLKNDDLLSIPIRTTGASTNARRKMEDRTICIDEFHKVYDVMNSAKSSFYGVFDGHNGYAAAHYVASQLPYIISKTSNATTDPVILLQKSFQITDSNFISRGATSSGTTAVCALYRPEEKRLFIAYAGDSKAMLAKQYGKVMQLVKSHRPDLEREKNRILSMRGFISSVSGVLRVNGTSNVTRSLGDAKFKPVLTGDPDCIVVDLDGKEEFLVLATDGLWDHAHETEIARTVYDCIKEDCENLDLIPTRLIKQAQDGQSTDNISVVVIFFKHPSQIAKNCDNLKIMESEFDNIKEVEYYDYSRNFYPTDENTTSNNSHAVDSKQMRWTPNDNLNNIISDEVNQTTTTTTTTSATTNNGQFDDNLLNSSDNIDLNQKLSPLVGSGDDNSLHHASTLENNGEEFLATGGGGYDNKNGKLLTPTTTGADEFDDNDDDQHNEDDNNQQQHQKILLDEKNHQPHHHDVDGDYGPETCVDVTDDVVMMTENSADTNNLSEQSTLSHSKDTLPSSDNCNPFDNKNALDMEETNEFHIEHAGGVDAHHIQLLDDANKATPLLSPEVEDLPLSSDGQMHFTNEGYQQSPLDEMIPAVGIVSSQKQFEDEFMQSNGHLSPIDGKDHELEKEEKLHDEESQEEIDALAKLDKFGGDLEEVQDMSNQKPELVENFFGNPIEPAELVLQEKEILFNNMNSDENDFRLKDEEEVLEKHVVESEEFAVKESSEALDLSQKEQLQHSLHNLEVDILEEKPILTGHYLGEFDESPLDELAPAHNDDEEEKLNEFADEKQDKEEFPEKEDKIEEKLTFVEQKSTPSEEIELEEDNCIHLEEDVRPSDYLAMLERQKEEQQHQQLGQLDEGFEKDVQFEEEEDDVMIKSEKEHENSLFEDDNKVSDEMMEKEKSLPEEDNHISDNQLASNEYEKPLYEVEEFEKIAELQKQLQQPDEASMIAAEILDNNKLESEVVSMIEEQISLIEDAIVQPEKQCFEEPEKVLENLDLENNEQSFEEVEKQLEEQHIDDKPLPEPNNLADFGEELENRHIEGMNEQEQHVFEEVEKQTEENTEKQFEDLNTSADLEELEDEIANGKVGLEEQVFDEMEKQLEEDTEKELLNTSSNIEEHENRDILEPMDTQLDNATKLEDEEVEKFLAEQSFEEEVEKQLEENNEKQSQDSNILPATDDLKETEELENRQQIVETEEEDKEVDSCLEDIDKQVHVLAEFVEDLENKHFEELKLDDAAKIFGECSEEQLQKLEQQVLDANTIPVDRVEKIVAQPLFNQPEIDPENMMEVEEPIIVKEQVPIKPSALPVSGQEPSAVQPTHESCDESEDDEWKYTKEGQGEKQLGLQGDTVVEEELPQELQDAGVTFSINERKASGNILQQQISINTSNLIESINDTFEGLTQNITELADQAAAAAVTDNKEETLEQGIQNLNLSQSSTREKLDNIEDDEELSASEMNSRLNPEAKEFVPTFSPPASSATENGFGSGNNPATAIPHHFKDELISQSPRKGRESNMEDIKIPAENEFEEEIAHKPHELTGDEAITEPTENGGTELFQEMNWKEAMHGSEKEEGPLVDSPVTEESLEVVDNQMQYASAAPPNVCELSAPVDLDNAGMKESIYIENNTSNDDLNSVQILPVDDIEIEQDAPEMKDNDVISKEEVQEILTLASDEKIETRIEEEIEQKMENLLLSHDKEFTKDINQMEADQIPINGVEMPSEEPAAIQMEEQIIAVSEPIVEQKPQEPSAPLTAAEESAPSPVPVAEEALEGLGLGAAAAVVAATAVATVAATTAATTKSAVKKVEDEKNQKNLKKTSSATKSKVPDTKKPAVGSAAAKTSTVSSVSAAAKRTLADKPKPTAAASSLAAKKTVSSTVSAAAPRPRAAAPTASAGVKSAIEKKTTTSTTSTVKSRIDAKAPTTLATRKPLSSSATKTTTSSKPGDETKSSSSTVKSSTIGKSTLGSKPSVGSTRTSATNSITKPRPATASSAATTNGIATKTASAAKPTTLAPKSAGAAKPSTTSPRGTLTSTLRKTEAVKRKNLFLNECCEDKNCQFDQFLFK